MLARSASVWHIAENPVYAMRRAGKLSFALGVVFSYGLRVYRRGLEGEYQPKVSRPRLRKFILKSANPFLPLPGLLSMNNPLFFAPGNL